MSVALRSVAILYGLLGLAANALAQDAPKWADIECAQSKIQGPTVMRCRATQDYSGGSSGEGKVGPKGIGPGGTFRHWNRFGTVNGVKYLYFLKEATTTTSTVLPISLEQTVKDYAAQGQNATNFSSLMQIAGGDYLTYTNRDGESCIATRKVGSSAGLGNRWYLMATRCVAKGKTQSEADAISLLASANAPNAGF